MMHSEGTPDGGSDSRDDSGSSGDRDVAIQLGHCRQQVERWEWFFENSVDILCICGYDGHFHRINRAFERAVGCPREQLLAQPLWDLIHPDDIERTRHEIMSVASGVDTINFENRLRHADGSWRWLSWNCPGARKGDYSFHALGRDITGEKRSAQEILYLAQHDPLTGLGNRALFEQSLALAMARVERTASHEVALMLLDLDGFKLINDHHGHGAGDHVLKVVAQRLRDQLRRIDVACRLGGDEFALIVEGCVPIQLERIANKVLKLVGEEVSWSQEPLQISGSLGYVTFPQPARNVGDMMSLADAAMYAAKQAGKNRFMRYDPSHTLLPAWAINPNRGDA
jgi:diguanylate cyclase (GGDEF)-like protein/PAS domain S-box-containing protein